MTKWLRFLLSSGCFRSFVSSFTLFMVIFPRRYSSQFGQGNSQYAYFHEEDESTFSLVDTSKQQKPLFQRQVFAVKMRKWILGFAAASCFF